MKEREDELWQYFDGTVIMAGPTFYTVLPTLMTEWLFSTFHYFWASKLPVLFRW